MCELIPFQAKSNIETHSKHYPFLLSSTHGKAYLGLVLNGYGFIFSKNLNQSLGQNGLAKTLYQKIIHPEKNQFHKREWQSISELEENLDIFEVVLCQSNKPLTKKELGQKQEKQKIDRVSFTSFPQRFYTCSIDWGHRINPEELFDYLYYRDITPKEFLKEKVRIKIKNSKKKFMPQLLSPFETLECLASPEIRDSIEYKPNFEKIKCYYGTMQRYTPEMKVPKRM
ncbi:hypothetical protein J4226_04215 [Candidatus Pacearchaeota archaeon]|nr:hypothetical protein [Candidatus Pacearchaeota archaeon]